MNEYGILTVPTCNSFQLQINPLEVSNMISDNYSLNTNFIFRYID